MKVAYGVNRVRKVPCKMYQLEFNVQVLKLAFAAASMMTLATETPKLLSFISPSGGHERTYYTYKRRRGDLLYMHSSGLEDEGRRKTNHLDILLR